MHIHVVRLGRLAPRVQERLGNPPVVRQEHQPRALLIEPPHGEHANGLHPTSPSLRTTSRASARVISTRGVVGSFRAPERRELILQREQERVGAAGFHRAHDATRLVIFEVHERVAPRVAAPVAKVPEARLDGVRARLPPHDPPVQGHDVAVQDAARRAHERAVDEDAARAHRRVRLAALQVGHAPNQAETGAEVPNASSSCGSGGGGGGGRRREGGGTRGVVGGRERSRVGWRGVVGGGSVGEKKKMRHVSRRDAGWFGALARTPRRRRGLRIVVVRGLGPVDAPGLLAVRALELAAAQRRRREPPGGVRLPRGASAAWGPRRGTPARVVVGDVRRAAAGGVRAGALRRGGRAVRSPARVRVRAVALGGPLLRRAGRARLALRAPAAHPRRRLRPARASSLGRPPAAARAPNRERDATRDGGRPAGVREARRRSEARGGDARRGGEGGRHPSAPNVCGEK